MEVALTEGGLDGVGGVLAQGAVEEGGAETPRLVVGAPVQADIWGGKVVVVSRGPWGTPRVRRTPSGLGRVEVTRGVEVGSGWDSLGGAVVVTWVVGGGVGKPG